MLVHEAASEGNSDPTTECRNPNPQQDDRQQPRHHHHPHCEPVVKEVHPHSFRFHCSSSNSFSRSPTTQRQPLPPSQFVIEKQGRFEEDVWRTRVLSLDSTHHRLFLSKSSKVDSLHHRCMVRIDGVKLWPRFNSLRIGEGFDSDSARRTVCIKGLVGVKPSALSFATRFFGPSTNTVASSSVLGRFLGSKKAMKEEQDEISTAQLSAGKYLSPQLAPASAHAGGGGRSVSEVDIAEFGEFTTEVWMIRAMSADDVRLLARALRRTIPDTCGLAGSHGFEEDEGLGE